MKYLLALFGEEPDMSGEFKPEEMAAMTQAWTDYGAALVKAGAYIAGEGLQTSATAKSVKHGFEGETVVTDGPFAETKEQLGGFYLLECASLDEAVEWAKQVPGPGGTVEVRPVMDFSEFGYEDPSAGAAS